MENPNITIYDPCEICDHKNEVKQAKNLKIEINPITVSDFILKIDDDFNGEAHLILSNGDTVDYLCEAANNYEIKGAPGYKIRLYINNSIIHCEDFLDNYVAGAGSFVGGMLRIYTKHLEKKYSNKLTYKL